MYHVRDACRHNRVAYIEAFNTPGNYELFFYTASLKFLSEFRHHNINCYLHQSDFKQRQVRWNDFGRWGGGGGGRALANHGR